MGVLQIDAYEVRIYVAGDLTTARQALREFCERGLCVTVRPVDFVYTGGMESGVEVGLINYPRHPESKDEIWETALELARFLRSRLFQDSALIQDGTTSKWVSRRADD